MLLNKGPDTRWTFYAGPDHINKRDVQVSFCWGPLDVPQGTTRWRRILALSFNWLPTFEQTPIRDVSVYWTGRFSKTTFKGWGFGFQNFVNPKGKLIPEPDIPENVANLLKMVRMILTILLVGLGICHAAYAFEWKALTGLSMSFSGWLTAMALIYLNLARKTFY
jgi:hypothetical protein